MSQKVSLTATTSRVQSTEIAFSIIRALGLYVRLTRILSQIEQGDPQVAEKLLPLVYDELRKLAAAKVALEKPGQTLHETAAIGESASTLGIVSTGGKGARRSAEKWTR